jgi:urate oxidase
VERDGVKYTFLEAPADYALARPVTREFNTPHDYTKSWSHLYEGDTQTYTNTDCGSIQAVALNIGSFKAPGFI